VDSVAPLLSAVESRDRYVENILQSTVRVAGTSVPVDVNAVSVVWEGEPAVLIVLHDVSKRVSAEGRLRELGRINDVLRRVNHAVINASNVEELERNVCETLVDAEPYLLAWIGGADGDGNVVPRASAGEEDGYLDEVEITVDDGPTGQGPTGRAFRTRDDAGDAEHTRRPEVRALA